MLQAQFSSLRLVAVASLLVLSGVATLPAAAQTAVVAGYYKDTQRDVPEWGGITAVAAGSCHVLGLKADGTVIATGEYLAGPCNVSGWSGIAALAAGRNYSVGLKRDGTVVVAGFESSGQSKVSDWSGIAAIASGGSYTVGLRHDGSVVSTAASLEGELSGWRGIAAVAAGGGHILGLKSDGTVLCVGNNGWGQRSVSGWRGITAVAAGESHSVGLKADGTVVAVGGNDYGQCNVSGWRGIVALAAGPDHTVGLKRDGTVVAVGTNEYGQCNVFGWRGITAIAAGFGGTVGLRAPVAGPYLHFSAQPSGAPMLQPFVPPIRVSVRDRFGETMGTAGNPITLLMGANPGGGRLSGTTTATAVNGVATFDNVCINRVGKGYTLLATAAGLGSAMSEAFDISPVPAKLTFTAQPSDAPPGGAIAPAVKVSLLDAAGTLVPRAHDLVTLTVASGPDGAETSGTTTVQAVNGVATFTDVRLSRPGAYTLRAGSPGLASATSAPFTVLVGQTVFAVGDHDYDKHLVAGWSGITAIASGWNFTVGLKCDGTVVAIGDYQYGDCDVSDWREITAIAAGSYHTVGLKSDGTLVATGNNWHGQCQVSEWHDIIAVAAGPYHTVGLKRDGTVWSVGSGSSWGQIPEWRGIIAVAAGEAHTVGLKGDGTVVSAGSDSYGWRDVSGWREIIAVAEGYRHTVGLKSDGTVVAVGNNENGQCNVADWRGIIAISAGQYHTIGLRSDGTVLAVGENGYGQCNVSEWRGMVAIGGGSCSWLTLGLKASPEQLRFSTQPTAGRSLQALPPVTVALLDTYGNVVDGAANTVTLSLAANPSRATLSGARAVVAANGIATFQGLRIDKPGRYTLAASSSGVAGTTSSTFEITPPPAKLAFTLQPANAVAGAALSPAVKVAVLDAAGNVAAAETPAVSLSIAAGPAGATLSGVSTAVAVRGIATFANLKMDKAGTYYLRAASLTGLSGATSRAFTITAGPPAKLAFTVQPGSTAAGAPISPAVRVAVQDRMGNALPAATHLVTLALSTNPTAAFLFGTKSVAVTNGVAAFAGLSIAKAGSGYVLRATAPGLTTAYSAPFDVTPGAAARLVFLTQPAGAKVGAALAPAVKVGIQDGRGNLVTTASNAVTVRLGRNRTGAVLTGAAAVAEAGIATFADLKVDKAGAGYTLAASAPGLAGAACAPFSVTQ